MKTYLNLMRITWNFCAQPHKRNSNEIISPFSFRWRYSAISVQCSISKVFSLSLDILSRFGCSTSIIISSIKCKWCVVNVLLRCEYKFDSATYGKDHHIKWIKLKQRGNRNLTTVVNTHFEIMPHIEHWTCCRDQRNCWND